MVTSIGADPAGIFRAHGDDHPQLGRDDVQPFAAILTNLVHDTAAAELAVPSSLIAKRPIAVFMAAQDDASGFVGCAETAGTWHRRHDPRPQLVRN